jgi:hypothetical protein
MGLAGLTPRQPFSLSGRHLRRRVHWCFLGVPAMASAIMNETLQQFDGSINLELPDFNPCLTAKPRIQSIRRHKTSQNLVRQRDVSED